MSNAMIKRPFLSTKPSTDLSMFGKIISGDAVLRG